MTGLLRPYNPPYGPYTYLGAERSGGDGWDDKVFRWEDGTPWDYSDWSSNGHPCQGCECLVLGYISNTPETWVDYICGYRDPWADCLCKRRQYWDLQSNSFFGTVV